MLAILGLEDALLRCAAYEAAGVDALFLAGMKDTAHLEAICASVKIPVMLGNVPKGMQDRTRLAQLGVRVTLQGHQSFTAAMAGAHRVLSDPRNGVRPGDIAGLPDSDFLEKLMRARLQPRVEKISRPGLIGRPDRRYAAWRAETGGATAV